MVAQSRVNSGNELSVQRFMDTALSVRRRGSAAFGLHNWFYAAGKACFAARKERASVVSLWSNIVPIWDTQ
jgi:hypothetical protein